MLLEISSQAAGLAWRFWADPVACQAADAGGPLSEAELKRRNGSMVAAMKRVLDEDGVKRMKKLSQRFRRNDIRYLIEHTAP